MNLQGFKDVLAKEAHGITAAKAWYAGICIACKEQALPKCHSKLGCEEYAISAMCEECFDGLFKEEEEVTTAHTGNARRLKMKVTIDDAKQMEYEYAPNSQRAIDEAALLGMDVVFPAANQLQIDIDSDEAYDRYLRVRPLLERHLSDIEIEEHPSRSGGENRHITLTLSRNVTDIERILLQACLGSDPVREFLGYIQVLEGDPHPVLFLEKRNAGLQETRMGSQDDD